MMPAHLDLEARRDRAARVHGAAGPALVDPELAEHVARGWPNLCVLEGATRSPEKAVVKILRSIDPSIGPVWPRDVAARWLNLYLDGVDGHRGDIAEVVASGPEDVPSEDRVHAFFVRCLGATRPYPFEKANVVWIAEALLGPDVVTRILAHVLDAAPPDAWCWPNEVFPNPNQAAIHVVAAAAWTILRTPHDAAEPALAILRTARARHAATNGPLARVVDALLGTRTLSIEEEWERRLSMPHLDEASARARCRHPWSLWLADPQDLWLHGATPPRAFVEKLAAEPRWLPDHLLRIWAPFRHPFVDAVRSAHANRPKKLTKKQLDVEVRALFVQIVDDVKRVRGDAAREAAVFTDGARALVRLRARSGDPTPDHHVAHMLGVDGWDKKTIAPMTTLDASNEESERWFAAIGAGLE